MFDWWHDQERQAALGKACPYCQTTMVRWRGGIGSDVRRSPSRDHIHPRSKGGSDSDCNILIVCWTCNNDKKDLTLGEFYGHLLVTDDQRFRSVGLLMKDVADYDASVGADLYADAGVYIAHYKRQKVIGNPPKTVKLQRTIKTDSVSGEELNRRWIAERVMQNLEISPKYWKLSSQGKVLSITVGPASHKFPVYSTDSLEKDVRHVLGMVLSFYETPANSANQEHAYGSV